MLDTRPFLSPRWSPTSIWTESRSFTISRTSLLWGQITAASIDKSKTSPITWDLKLLQIRCRRRTFSFVKQGIPALAISEGFKTVDPALDGKKITVSWMTTRYHTPQDDMNQPLNFTAARRCTQIILAVGYEVASVAERPAWNPEDTFGQRFGKHQAGM